MCKAASSGNEEFIVSRKHRKDRKNATETVAQKPAAPANPASGPAPGAARPGVVYATIAGLIAIVIGGGFLVYWMTSNKPSGPVVPSGPKPQVVIETSEGPITVELFQRDAPISVENFLKYIDDKHYDGTIFHRVIPGFMIQGGGFLPGMKKKTGERAFIKNEARNGLSNTRGTLAMARTNIPDSATDQFFINLKDNAFLDRAKAQDGVGYAVFGRVISGMEVVDKIAQVDTATISVPEPRAPGGIMEHEKVPVQDVLIKSVRRVETK